ncbi:hypothetical protein RRG08_059554 [Elysia crispata]|uniref:Uncharacterized protein n=1 Tax=Elysia crispata TaxID=231223 RepID=A0AAE1B9A7_9GAST|nr:hypothetical protein RRG08_059554 [Elysia crispata]
MDASIRLVFATLLAALATSSGLTMVKRSVDDNSSTTETNTTEVNTTLIETRQLQAWACPGQPQSCERDEIINYQICACVKCPTGSYVQQGTCLCTAPGSRYDQRLNQCGK